MHVCFISQGYANINVFTHVIVNLVFMLVSFIKVNINVIFYTPCYFIISMINVVSFYCYLSRLILMSFLLLMLFYFIIKVVFMLVSFGNVIKINVIMVNVILFLFYFYD